MYIVQATDRVCTNEHNKMWIKKMKKHTKYNDVDDDVQQQTAEP